jgi:hypothetical protein
MSNIVQRFVTCVAAFAVTLTPFVALAQKSPGLTPAHGGKDYEIVVSLPVGGADGVNYANVGIPEIEVTGPASFTITRDGSFLIADTSTSRILFVSQESTVRAISVPDARGIVDLAVAKNGDVLTLDFGQDAIHRVKPDGAVERISLPTDARSNGLTGIAVTKTGEIVLEQKGGSKLVNLKGAQIRSQELHDKEVSVSLPNLTNTDSGRGHGEILMGDKAIAVDVPNTLVGLQVLGLDQAGGVFISVDELVSFPAIAIDETIRHYDKAGELIGIARVPLTERFTYTQRGVVVGDDGNVYAMVPRPDRLDVVRLLFKKAIPPILEPFTPQENAVGIRYAHARRVSPAVLSSCSRSRTQMTAAANEFVNNQVYLTSTNLTGYCFGRTAPRYLGTSPGYKRSVGYDWGGGDSVYDYNRYMSLGYQAGDIPIYSTGVESCSKGVDCSGFISRVWGVSGKYSTTTLPGISTQLTDVSRLQMGDILNLYNSHVVMFNGMANGGINAWESTVYGSQDRVVYGYVPWTRLNGYVPYRYNGVCNTGSVSQSVTPTVIWVTRGSTATFTVYEFTSDGFRGSVNLYALNLPGAVLAGTGFYPQTINVTSNNTWFGSTLKIVTNSTTPTGSRVITIEGRSGDRTLRSYVQLNVL